MKTQADRCAKLVVVIDDDPLVLEATAGLLNSWGCQAVTAESYGAALDQLAAISRRPDLIICDYRLSEGNNGIDVIEGLRSAYEIPALLISGDPLNSEPRRKFCKRVLPASKAVRRRQVSRGLGGRLRAAALEFGMAIPVRDRVGPLDLGWILLLGVLWGIPYALTKISLETIPPLTLVTARASIAAIILWLIVIVLRRETPATWNFAARIFIQGLLCCVVPYTLLAFGQQTVDSGLAAVLNSTAPLFVCLISLLWTRTEQLTPTKILGVISGFVGVVGVAGVSALAGLGQQTLAQTVIVLAAVSSAMSAIHGRRFDSVAPEVVAAGTLTAAAILLFPFCLFIEKPWQLWPSAPSVAALIVNAVVATALGFVVYFKLLRTIGSVGTTSTSYLKPAVGVLIGVCLLGEPLTWPFVVALAAILGGIATINSGRKRSPAHAVGQQKSEFLPTPT